MQRKITQCFRYNKTFLRFCIENTIYLMNDGIALST